MTKIYLAENFLEADQIISELEANHIFAKKHEIIETSITARMAKPVFEIYVDDKNVEKAVEIIYLGLLKNINSAVLSNNL